MSRTRGSTPWRFEQWAGTDPFCTLDEREIQRLGYDRPKRPNIKYRIFFRIRIYTAILSWNSADSQLYPVLATKRRAMINVEVSETIRAPRDEVFSLVAGYEDWPRTYPHIKSVRPLGQKYGEIVLELDTVVGGIVTIVQRTRKSDKIVQDLKNHKVYGKNIYTFETLLDGTRVTLAFSLSLKSFFRPLAPFVKGYIRKQLQSLVLLPLKNTAEAKKTQEDQEKASRSREEEIQTLTAAAHAKTVI